MAQNVLRRHLSVGQRAIIAARFATTKFGDNQHTKAKHANLRTLHSGDELIGQAGAANVMKVSLRTVTAAKKVLDSGNAELIGKVERDEIAVNAAAKSIPKPKPPKRTKEEKRTERIAMKDGKGVPATDEQVDAEFDELWEPALYMFLRTFAEMNFHVENRDTVRQKIREWFRDHPEIAAL
jgi:hypothetical protein